MAWYIMEHTHYDICANTPHSICWDPTPTSPDSWWCMYMNMTAKIAKTAVFYLLVLLLRHGQSHQILDLCNSCIGCGQGNKKEINFCTNVDDRAVCGMWYCHVWKMCWAHQCGHHSKLPSFCSHAVGSTDSWCFCQSAAMRSDKSGVALYFCQVYLIKYIQSEKCCALLIFAHSYSSYMGGNQPRWNTQSDLLWNPSSTKLSPTLSLKRVYV